MNFSRQSPSKKYLELIDIYKKMHEKGDKNPNSAVSRNPKDTYKGDQTKYYIKDIKSYIAPTNSKTILDYGSGKAAFYKQLEMGISDAYSYTGPIMAMNVMDTDAAEGFDAFIEKREPEWDQMPRDKSMTEE